MKPAREFTETAYLLRFKKGKLVNHQVAPDGGLLFRGDVVHELLRRASEFAKLGGGRKAFLDHVGLDADGSWSILVTTTHYRAPVRGAR